MPANKNPTCPKWIDKNAKTEWRKCVRMAQAAGVITEWDGNALARYCQAWSDYRRYTELINERGDSYQTESGEWREHPEAARRQKTIDVLLRLEQQFGFTPSARASLTVEKKTDTIQGKGRFFRDGGDLRRVAK
jgi:P27 family predicted phage terminase small subunit